MQANRAVGPQGRFPTQSENRSNWAARGQRERRLPVPLGSPASPPLLQTPRRPAELGNERTRNGPVAQPRDGRRRA